MVDPKELVQLRKAMPNAGLSRGAIGKIIDTGRGNGALHVEFYDDNGWPLCDAFLDSTQIEPLSETAPPWARDVNICMRCRRIYHSNSVCA